VTSRCGIAVVSQAHVPVRDSARASGTSSPVHPPERKSSSRNLLPDLLEQSVRVGSASAQRIEHVSGLLVVMEWRDEGPRSKTLDACAVTNV
jgi:hypothetical protein